MMNSATSASGKTNYRHCSSSTSPATVTKICSTFCKLILVMSHGESNVGKSFSVNKEVLQDSLMAESFISQQLIYGPWICTYFELHVLPYHLHCIKAAYKVDLERQREDSCGAFFKL